MSPHALKLRAADWWRRLPKSRLGRFTFWLFASALLLYAASVAPGLAPSASRVLQEAAADTGFVAVVLFGVLLVRQVRHKFLWRLRNRLLVTYLFIGVIPVVLLVAMAAIAGYLFAGQFAIYVATSDIQSEVSKLERQNLETATRLATDLHLGRRLSAARLADLTRSEKLAGNFPSLDVSVWYGSQAMSTGAPAAQPPTQPGKWAGEEFAGVVTDDNKTLTMRASTVVPVSGQEMMVVSSVPFDGALLDHIAGNSGEFTFWLGRARVVVGNEEREAGLPGIPRSGPGDQPRRVFNPNQMIRGGTVSPEQKRTVQFVTLFPVREWGDGTEHWLVLYVRTALAPLYQRLFSNYSRFGSAIRILLAAVAIAFAVIELLALLIGSGLTRTITRSIANLYKATEHINRGDFKHRIVVKNRDQLAALEESFNSMSASLEKLIAEQKEKQKLESELAIAQEVQAQLFPREAVDLPSLELHGVCRPARIVSGDYYDFVPLGSGQLGIAVGDISGKGISAALLMATIHSAVRAYELPHVLQRAETAAAAGPHSRWRENDGAATTEAVTSPAIVLSLLNRQLYRSTPSEKYATLFLGIFDGAQRRLTYANAGHPSPLLLDRSGSARKLDDGGTVVGLFDETDYEEHKVDLRPGDILIAYTDGITEPENDFGEFGEERVLEIVRQHRHVSLAHICEQVIAAVQDWIGTAEQPDDLTLVLARAR